MKVFLKFVLKVTTKKSLYYFTAFLVLKNENIDVLKCKYINYKGKLNFNLYN